LELLGQRDVELAQSHEDYSRLWQVFKAVKDGQITLDRVTLEVDQSGKLAWEVAADPSNPAPENNEQPADPKTTE